MLSQSTDNWPTLADSSPAFFSPRPWTADSATYFCTETYVSIVLCGGSDNVRTFLGLNVLYCKTDDNPLRMNLSSNEKYYTIDYQCPLLNASIIHFTVIVGILNSTCSRSSAVIFGLLVRSSCLFENCLPSSVGHREKSCS